jgi:hypothetical protein
VQNAPSVAYPVGRFVWERRVLALAACGGAVVWALWWLQRWSITHTPSPSGWLLALAWLGAGLLWCWHAWRAERHSPVGELVWMSEAPHAGWYLERAGQLVPVVPWVAVDGGRCLWLRLEPAQGPSLWVWALRQDDPTQWLALRRSLQRVSASVLTPGV